MLICGSNKLICASNMLICGSIKHADLRIKQVDLRIKHVDAQISDSDLVFDTSALFRVYNPLRHRHLAITHVSSRDRWPFFFSQEDATKARKRRSDTSGEGRESTYEKPMQFATGVVDVFVNGVEVLKDGETHGRQAGEGGGEGTGSTLRSTPGTRDEQFDTNRSSARNFS
jgi:hypothetical protein